MKLEKEHFQRIPEILGLKYSKPPRDDRGFFYCPFHSESKPSLSMSFDKGIWNCFSCHKGGSINELVKELTNQNIYQVLGIDHEFTGLIKKVEYQNYVEQEIDESKINIDIRGIVVPYTQSPEALNYLKVRGIEHRIADKYNFQYAHDIYINGWKFIKRLLIPIYGETGKLVNMEGRDVTRNNQIKVLYPKNSIKPLWNIQNLDYDKPLYITEGLIDLFLLEQDDFFNNLTVQFGSAISPYQKKMIEKFKTIITIFNNDEAGERSVESLRRELGRKIDKLEFSKDFNDIGEIWELGHMTVKEYREKYGFKLKRDNAFFL